LDIYTKNINDILPILKKISVFVFDIYEHDDLNIAIAKSLGSPNYNEICYNLLNIRTMDCAIDTFTLTSIKYLYNYYTFNTYNYTKDDIKHFINTYTPLENRDTIYKELFNKEFKLLTDIFRDKIIHEIRKLVSLETLTEEILVDRHKYIKPAVVDGTKQKQNQYDIKATFDFQNDNTSYSKELELFEDTNNTDRYIKTRAHKIPVKELENQRKHICDISIYTHVFMISVFAYYFLSNFKQPNYNKFNEVIENNINTYLLILYSIINIKENNPNKLPNTINTIIIKNDLFLHTISYCYNIFIQNTISISNYNYHMSIKYIDSKQINKESYIKIKNILDKLLESCINNLEIKNNNIYKNFNKNIKDNLPIIKTLKTTPYNKKTFDEKINSFNLLNDYINNTSDINITTHRHLLNNIILRKYLLLDNNIILEHDIYINGNYTYMLYQYLKIYIQILNDINRILRDIKAPTNYNTIENIASNISNSVNPFLYYNGRYNISDSQLKNLNNLLKTATNIENIEAVFIDFYNAYYHDGSNRKTPYTITNITKKNISYKFIQYDDKYDIYYKVLKIPDINKNEFIANMQFLEETYIVFIYELIINLDDKINIYTFNALNFLFSDKANNFLFYDKDYIKNNIGDYLSFNNTNIPNIYKNDVYNADNYMQFRQEYINRVKDEINNYSSITLNKIDNDILILCIYLSIVNNYLVIMYKQLDKLPELPLKYVTNNTLFIEYINIVKTMLTKIFSNEELYRNIIIQNQKIFLDSLLYINWYYYLNKNNDYINKDNYEKLKNIIDKNVTHSYNNIFENIYSNIITHTYDFTSVRFIYKELLYMHTEIIYYRTYFPLFNNNNDNDNYTSKLFLYITCWTRILLEIRDLFILYIRGNEDKFQSINKQNKQNKQNKKQIYNVTSDDISKEITETLYNNNITMYKLVNKFRQTMSNMTIIMNKDYDIKYYTHGGEQTDIDNFNSYIEDQIKKKKKITPEPEPEPEQASEQKQAPEQAPSPEQKQAPELEPKQAPELELEPEQVLVGGNNKIQNDNLEVLLSHIFKKIKLLST